MPNFSQKKAGLAIYDGVLYFTELDSDNQPIQKQALSLPEGCIVNGSIASIELLEAGFTQIHKQAGKIHTPVNIGIPPGDAIIRVLNLPRMSLEDIRSTLDLNFEEYFPFSRLDAVFDVMTVRTPIEYDDRDEIPVLAVAVRRNIVERVLDCARKAGFEAESIEPVNFAMLRAVPDTKSGMCVFADPHSIITTWEGNGILYRSANNVDGIQDILNTIQFLSTQYRGVNVDKLIMSGLNFQLNTNSAIKIITMDDPYFAAEGLALRDTPDTPTLDLRPMEYVELERRRHSFSLTRLTLWALLAAFLGTSVGTIYFGVTQTEDLKERIASVREANSEFIQRRIALTEANAKLERQKDKAERVLNFFRGNIPALEVMNALEANSGTGIKFTDADFVRGNDGGVTVTVNGRASEERAVLLLSEGLKQSRIFENVTVPVSRKDFTGGMIFRLVLKVRDTL